MIETLLAGLGEPCPADWGFNVSVGIALIADHRKTLITVTDAQVNFGTFSADYAALKNKPIHKNWTVLIAGNDVEHADPILNRASDILRQSPPENPIDVANAVDEAFSERIHNEINNSILRKRGFDVDSFREKRKQKCTPSVYLSLCSRIDQVKISLKFLVCGFDGGGEAHIFLVDGEHAPKNYDRLGMWAIGSGAHSALSFLAFHADQGAFGDLTTNEGAYLALGAKFMAETSSDVGKKAAFIMIFENGTFSNRRSVPYPLITKMKEEIWIPEGMPRLPENIEERMSKYILTRDEYRMTETGGAAAK
ncbi:MAG: hypothetical protein WA738_22125 [Candidatus Angelobacter sp.]